MRRIFLTLVCASALAACGAASTSSSSPGSGAGTGGSTSTTVATAAISSLGTVLTDAQGRTLYYFLPEQGATIGACTGGCLTTWPPVTVTGTPTSASGATGTLGVVSVTVNGAQVSEVTYNSWPLHTYAGDSASGQANGQGIGGKWFAAEPATSATESGATGGPAGPTPTSTPSGGNPY